MHRWFVLEMDSEKSRHEKSDKESDSSFLFPFYWAPLRKQADSRAKERPQNYRHIEEGMERAWLAAALEDITEKQEASKQWVKAQTLLGGKAQSKIHGRLFLIYWKRKRPLHT